MSEYLSLSINEKIEITKSLLKSLQYLKFELDLKIKQEEALPLESQRDLEAFRDEYADALLKEQTLISELANLEAQIV